MSSLVHIHQDVCCLQANLVVLLIISKWLVYWNDIVHFEGYSIMTALEWDRGGVEGVSRLPYEVVGKASCFISLRLFWSQEGKSHKYSGWNFFFLTFPKAKTGVRLQCVIWTTEGWRNKGFAGISWLPAEESLCADLCPPLKWPLWNVPLEMTVFVL